MKINLLNSIRFALTAAFLVAFGLRAGAQTIENTTSMKTEEGDEKVLKVDYFLSASANVTMSVILVNQSNLQKTIIDPMDDEVSGDIGDLTVLSAGGDYKHVTWKWEKTLKRLEMTGKFESQVVLQIEGKVPLAARLTLKGFENDNFVLKGPKPTEIRGFESGKATFNGSNERREMPDTPLVAQRWSTAVEPGAVFYAARTVSNFPYYNHSSKNFYGSPGLPSGSSFFAIKDAGTANRKVWINFGNQKLVGPEGHQVTWDFQMRLLDSKDAKSCKIYTVSQTNVLTEQGLPIVSKLSIDWADANKDTSNEVEIERKSATYTWRDKLQFDVLDDGAWNGAGENTIVNSDGSKVIINQFLTVNGSVTIDTLNGLVTTMGNMYIPLKSGELQNILIGAVPNQFLMTDTCFALYTTGASKIVQSAMNFIGIALLMNKVDLKANPSKEVVIDAGLKLPAINKCEEPELEDPLDSSPDWSSKELVENAKVITFQLKVDNLGLHFPLALKITGGLAVAPGMCLSEAGWEYDEEKKYLKIAGSLTTPLAESISGEIGFKDGKFDALMGKLKSDVICIPIPIMPPPPAPPQYCWAGGKLSMSGVQEPPLKLGIEGYFRHAIVGKETGLNDITLGIEWTYPWIFSGYTQVDLFKIPILGYQARVEGRITLDVQKSLTETGAFRCFTLSGGTDYFINGEAEAVINWLPEFKSSLSVSGYLQIPSPSSSNLLLQTAISIFRAAMPNATLPYRIGGVKGSIEGNSTSTILTFSADWTGFPGAKCTLDLSKVTLDDAIAFINLATERKSAEVAKAVGGGKLADYKTVNFAATSDNPSIVVSYKNPAGVPTLQLKNPSGMVFMGTTQDSTIVFFTSEDSKQAFVRILNPAAGEWSLLIYNQLDNDTVDVFTVTKMETSFAIAATADGNQVTATWDNAKALSGEKVDIYWNTNNTEFKGGLLGTADATAGTATFDVSDKVSACSFYIYGIKYGVDISARAFAEGKISVSKGQLQPPTGLQAISDQWGKTIISWTRSVDTANATGYSIMVRDLVTGQDSLFTNTAAWNDYHGIILDNHANKAIYLVTFNKYGVKGCPSEIISITTGTEDETPTPQAGANGDMVYLLPNPAVDAVSVFFDNQADGHVRAELFDMQGNRIALLSDGTRERGILKFTASVSGLPDGAYLVRVETSKGSFSKILIVAK